MSTEHVLAVRNTGFKSGLSDFSGFNSDDLMMGSRAWLEQDSNFLQVIPYLLIQDTEGRFLTYARTKKGGESRLNSKYSCGFGGHVNADDVYSRRGVLDFDHTIYRATQREVGEELDVPTPDYLTFYDLLTVSNTCKLLYDPSNAVGSVHIGLVKFAVFEMAALKHQITSRDEGISVQGFYHADYLLSGEDDIELESWTKIVLEGL